jgi:hypothetical protein
LTAQLEAPRSAAPSVVTTVVTTLPARYRAYERTLAPPYDALYRRLAVYIGADRLITDPLRLLSWGTDASFYRLVPKLVVVVDNEHEVVRLRQLEALHGRKVTSRSGGRGDRSERSERSELAER